MKLILQKAKNYLSFISKLEGSRMWQNLYVIGEDGVEFDATKNGDKSCAYMLSSVLTIFGLIDRPHATTESTVKSMLDAGWLQIGQPEKGCVVRWEKHIGFYIDDDFVISNRSEDKAVARHSLVMSDGSRPIRYYIHPDIKQK